MMKQVHGLTLGSLLAILGCNSGPADEDAPNLYGQQMHELNTSTEVSVDRPGFDYRSFELRFAQPSACRDACRADSRCKAYTYVGPGQPAQKARCYLKSSIPNPVRNNCCTSGTNTHTEIEIDQRIDRPGGDYRDYDLPIANPIGCQLACDREARCRAYTYVQPRSADSNGHCYLKDRVTAAVPCDTCTSEAKFLSMSTEMSFDRPGGDYREAFLPRADYKLCRAACDLDPRCQAYTYAPPGLQGQNARCYLKDQRPNPVLQGSMISGARF